MEKWSISNVIEILKSPKLVCWVAITCAFLLFFPSKYVPSIYLSAFREKYGIIIVFPFFGSLSMIGIYILQWIYEKWKRKKTFKNRTKYLHQLTNDEKAILRKYIERKTKTQKLSIMDGVVKGLEYAGVIYCSAQLGGGPSVSFDYNIQPWAWNYLNEHSSLLDNLA